MPRPNLKEQRREEILKAYEKCIAKYGVAGATQQRVADEANIARALLRHNIGNSDELLKQVVTRFKEKNITELGQFIEYAQDSDLGTDQFIEALFDDNSDKQSVMIASALVISAQDNKYVKKQMSEWFKKTRDLFFHYFKLRNKAKLNEDQILNITDGIVALYFNYESLSPLSKVNQFKESSIQASKFFCARLNK